MLIQMVRLDVSFYTYFTEMRPSDGCCCKDLSSSSFRVNTSDMRYRFINIVSKHLTAFFTNEFILSGGSIEKIGEMLLRISVANQNFQKQLYCSNIVPYEIKRSKVSKSIVKHTYVHTVQPKNRMPPDIHGKRSTIYSRRLDFSHTFHMGTRCCDGSI